MNRPLSAPLVTAALIALSTTTAAQAPTPAAPAAAPAPPPPLSQVLSGVAKGEFEAGKILFQEGDYGNAVIKFERAYELAHEPRLLWNVALCEKNLKRYARLLRTVEKLLADGGPLLTEQDRKDAAELIQAIQRFVSRLDIRSTEAGAEVLVDGEPAGTTPLAAPVVVDLGSHRITVRKKGWKTVELTRDAAGGAALSIAVALEKEVHRGQLAVKAGPNDLIAIDGKMVGRGAWDGPVPSGGHTLRVTARGMKPQQSEVMIQDGQSRDVRVTLEPQPESGELERWLWIGGGVALFAGAAVAGAVLFQPQPPVQGNTTPGTVTIAGARGLTLRFGGQP